MHTKTTSLPGITQHSPSKGYALNNLSQLKIATCHACDMHRWAVDC